MKKISLLLSFLMIISLFGVTVRAEGNNEPADEPVVSAEENEFSSESIEDYLNAFLLDKALFISGMTMNASYSSDIMSAMAEEKNVLETDMASHGAVITNISTKAENITIKEENESYVKVEFSESYSIDFNDALGNSDISGGVNEYVAEIIISDGQYDIVSLSRKVYEEGGSVPESELSPEISANGSNDEILGASSPSVEAAVQWAINTAYDQSHGYSQVNRWGNPDYDCSSFVISAFKNGGGFAVPEYEWGNTATMRGTFESLGFTWYPESEVKTATEQYKNLQRGDILLRSGHTEIYIGEGKQVGAHNNQPSSYHPDRSPEPGDQGDEVSVCDWYNGNWEGVLRLGGEVGDIVKTENFGPGIYYINTTTGMNIRKGPGTNYEVLCITEPTGEILVYETEGHWGRVNYKGTVGWMSLDYSIFRRMVVITEMINFEAWFSDVNDASASDHEGEGIVSGKENNTYYLNYHASSPSGNTSNGVNNVYEVKLNLYDPDNGLISSVKFDKKDSGCLTYQYLAPGVYRGEMTITGNGTVQTVTKDFVVTAGEVKYVKMHRLYNPNTGEHFYTSASKEKKELVDAGWKYEGTAWTAPETSMTPVFRLYNPNAGEHHYTISKKEKNDLVKAGWKYEGVGWYSDEKKGTALYRLYNPNATVGSHHYTTSKKERKELIAAGWKDEGVAWYGK